MAIERPLTAIPDEDARALTHARALIEDWLPIAEVGAESQRDASAARKPPLNRLHVWWARRPLTASRAAILGSALPAWSPDWPEPLRSRFPSEQDYRSWFLQLLGIFGDPVRGAKLIRLAKEKGIKLPGNPYGAPRAFTVNPSDEMLACLQGLLELRWGTRDVHLLDSMAGGGSIPFEALRYGFTTYANELNPVASVILKATLDFPARFGGDLAKEIRKWGERWAGLVRDRLAPFFPVAEGENIFAYLWARTVPCPTTGKPVPLSPNWWLAKGATPMAVRLIADPAAEACRFEIVRGADAVERAKPDQGTVKRGVGRSPWTGDPIDGDTIKAVAQAGRMGQQLYAIGIKRRGGFDFRTPTPEDLAAVARAEGELRARWPAWEAAGLIPVEPYPTSSNDPRPIAYGMPRWCDLFSPRQLLSRVTTVEALAEVKAEMRAALPEDRYRAVSTYLALAFDKCTDRNSLQTRWIPQRQVIANTFDRHDYAFSWS